MSRPLTRRDDTDGHTAFAAFMRALDEMSFGGAASLECGIPGDPDILLPRCPDILLPRCPDILLPRCVEFLRHEIGS